MGSRAKDRYSRRFTFACAIIAALTVFSPAVSGQQRVHDAGNLALGELPILPTASAAALNPALLTKLNGTGISVSAYRPFGIPEMTDYTASWCRFGRRYGFGASVSSTGDGLMNEARGSLSFAGRINRHVSAGIGTRITQVSVENVGSATAATLTLGTMLTPANPVTFGVSVDGLARSVFGDLAWSEPRSTYLSAEYRMSSVLTVYAGAVHDTWRGWSHSVALAVIAHPSLAVRLGRTGGPDGVTGGLEYCGARYRIAYATRLHRALDATHAVTLSLIP